jgi:hypothetical protein
VAYFSTEISALRALNAAFFILNSACADFVWTRPSGNQFSGVHPKRTWKNPHAAIHERARFHLAKPAAGWWPANFWGNANLMVLPLDKISR